MDEVDGNNNIRRLEAWRDPLTGLEEWILDQQLGPGDQLPNESVLARCLGVGRKRVHSAIQALETAGVLEPSPVGATATTVDPATELRNLLQLHLSRSGFSSRDLLSVRIEFEPASVARAAVEATTQELEQLRSTVTAMTRPGLGHDKFGELDCQFHVGLASAAHNTLAAAVLTSLEKTLKQAMSAVYARTVNWPNTIARIAGEHRKILDAVEQGDPETAATQVAEHLTAFHGPSTEMGVSSGSSQMRV